MQCPFRPREHSAWQGNVLHLWLLPRFDLLIRRGVFHLGICGAGAPFPDSRWASLPRTPQPTNNAIANAAATLLTAARLLFKEVYTSPPHPAGLGAHNRQGGRALPHPSVGGWVFGDGQGARARHQGPKPSWGGVPVVGSCPVAHMASPPPVLMKRSLVPVFYCWGWASVAHPRLSSLPRRYPCTAAGNPCPPFLCWC